MVSHEDKGKRKYELRKRAATMADTRQRITEAAVELHGSVGPVRTTLTAVAERAGVQRHTVYRHFPTEDDLFDACSAHWAESNPWPDTSAWAQISDPRERLRTGLDELYRYYERTEPMWANVLRDAELVDAVRDRMGPMIELQRGAGRELAAGWPARGGRKRVVAAAARHVVDFRTWQSLVRDGGVSRGQAVELATAMVEGASG